MPWNINGQNRVWQLNAVYKFLFVGKGKAAEQKKWIFKMQIIPELEFSSWSKWGYDENAISHQDDAISCSLTKESHQYFVTTQGFFEKISFNLIKILLLVFSYRLILKFDSYEKTSASRNIVQLILTRITGNLIDTG